MAIDIIIAWPRVGSGRGRMGRGPPLGQVDLFLCRLPRATKELDYSPSSHSPIDPARHMSRSQVPFHVQHIARPTHVERVLLRTEPDQLLAAQSLHRGLLQDGYDATFDAVRRSLDLGSKLGLFQKHSRSGYLLAPRGVACKNLAQFRPEVYSDVMHFLLYGTWEMTGHREYWSWSYATVCKIMWRDRPSVGDRRDIFGELYAEASRLFPDLEPVVGTETVGAVGNWLRQLSPSFLVVEGGRIRASQERKWFSPELAVLAVSYLYAARRAPAGTPILLDREAIEMLCPLSLSSPATVNAMIETAARTFPILEIHRGEWGSSAVLKEPIGVETIVLS